MVSGAEAGTEPMRPGPTIADIREPVLLFDGVCNLCERCVRFVIRRDPAGRFRFASLQSPYARELLTNVTEADSALNSVVLIVNGEVYLKSSAMLQAARCLRWPWPLAGVFFIVPRFIRDAIYEWIGGHRYDWFGKKAECWVPTPELRDRFLG